jgi:hypothetical protein
VLSGAGDREALPDGRRGAGGDLRETG